MVRLVVRLGSLCAVALGALLLSGAQAQTLRAVMHSDLKIVDPIWTITYIVRNHGYMVWDTLFSLDAKQQIQPQMVERHEVSADGLTWTFTLRDGLKWHDGPPVTSEDCIASLKRWAARDSMGQQMMAAVSSLEAVDAKTFRMVLKEPYGVLQALAKPSSGVPFIMPKRLADTDPGTQIQDVVGSGPFIFKKDEWRPG
jgi:peptide/nickel transport system substrate-binding protein